ncbi:hypothetical protein B4065_1524 [Caldibacillus thermoamylovorans]|nr:hypothetical protein B4065_1524 [Caldibacillus thermoamylovorans]
MRGFRPKTVTRTELVVPIEKNDSKGLFCFAPIRSYDISLKK